MNLPAQEARKGTAIVEIDRRAFLGALGAGAAWSLLGGCSETSDDELFGRSNPSGLKVLVIGVDGATFDIIGPMAREGRLESLRALIERGVGAKLRSEEPMLSPALWTTIATGRSRAEHSIEGFVSKSRSDGANPAVVSSLDRKTVALWNIVGGFKKNVATVGWWVTWPAEAVRGVMVSDRVAHSRIEAWTEGDATERLTFPAEVLAGIKSSIVDPGAPPMDEIEALVKLTAAEKKELLDAKKPIFGHGPSVFKYGYCAQRTYEEIALKLLGKSQPDLGMVFLIAVDPVCHTFWHYFRPEEFGQQVDRAEAERLGKLIPAVYEHTDRYIGRLLSGVDSDTVVLIVSDHGFQGTGRLPRMTSTVDYRKMGIERVERLDGAMKTGMSGWHHMDGVLIAAGGPIVAGAKPSPQATIADIAPTVLALMGLPVARDISGRVLEEVIHPEFMAGHPVQYVDSYEGRMKRESMLDVAGTGETEQLDYLRSLGYVE